VLPVLGLFALTGLATHHGAGRHWAPTLLYLVGAAAFILLRPAGVPERFRTVGYAGSGLAGIVVRGAIRAALGLVGVVVAFWAALRVGNPYAPEPGPLLLVLGWFGLMWPAIPSAQRTGGGTDMDIAALLRLPVRRTRVVLLLVLAGMLRPLPALGVLALLLGEPFSLGEALQSVLWGCGLGAVGGVYTALPMGVRLWAMLPTVVIAIPAVLFGPLARVGAPEELRAPSMLATLLLAAIAAWATRRALRGPIVWAQAGSSPDGSRVQRGKAKLAE
jgi:hypothetical protein